MEQYMQHYIYDGPVMQFNQCIVNIWHGCTYATSKAKARTNLTYQVKQQMHYIPGAKIELPGKIKIEDRRKTIDGRIQIQFR
jgi:hypothetical protein